MASIVLSWAFMQSFRTFSRCKMTNRQGVLLSLALVAAGLGCGGSEFSPIGGSGAQGSTTGGTTGMSATAASATGTSGTSTSATGTSVGATTTSGSASDTTGSGP